MSNQSILKEFISLVLKEGTSCIDIQMADIEFGVFPDENGHGIVADHHDSFATSDFIGRHVVVVKSLAKAPANSSSTSSTKHSKVDGDDEKVDPRQSWKLAARDFGGAKPVS